MQTQRKSFIDEGVEDTQERREFYSRIGQQNLAPLWLKLAALVTKEPTPRAVPNIWRYNDMRANLLEAVDIVDPAEAERRVLVMENPGLIGESKILDSLFSGLQIIAPGECAPAHRHQACALRFLIEGTSSYTAVNGERTMMEPGDFVLTPSWSWHDHACVGDHPTIWQDVLDMHIVNMLSGSFREETEVMQQDYPRPDDGSVLEYGRGVVPSDHQPEHNSSPIINYRYATVKDVLASMRSHRDIDPHFGYMIKYLDPMTGDWAMPTIAAQMRKLPQGFETKPYQSTDGTIFNVVEGRGESQIGDTTITWEQGDVFVAPQWAMQIHSATTEAVLFSSSDRAIQEKAQIWREVRHS
jgi:gentisate 1,2-dioxygenase